jgi:hypothetical protein
MAFARTNDVCGEQGHAMTVDPMTDNEIVEEHNE